jgi:hypothetical protein
MGNEGDTVFRTAVTTPEIAAVCDSKAKIIYLTPMVIDQGLI